MKKISRIYAALILLFVSVYFMNYALAEEDYVFVTAVAVKGNVNVKEKEILKAIKTKPMEVYSPDKVRDDLKNILDLGYFDDVTVEVSTYTYRILFIVQEKPLVKKIDFRGNKIVSNGKIKGEISNKKGERLDRDKLSSDVKKIIELYSDKGYADTEVTYDTLVDKITNQVNLTFFVNEGRKIVTDGVVVDGTRFFKAKKITGLMKTKKKKIFKEKTLEEDLKKITDYYKERGFESVVVSTPALEYNDDRTSVNVRINIDEGVMYRFGDISIEGNVNYTERELRRVLDIRTGQLYSQERMDMSVQGITELYSDKGYLQAQITPEFTKRPRWGRWM